MNLTSFAFYNDYKDSYLVRKLMIFKQTPLISIAVNGLKSRAVAKLIFTTKFKSLIKKIRKVDC